MYIRRTSIKSRHTGEPYYTYRLVESVRTGDKVQQKTRANLGRHFAVPREQWPHFVQRIEQIMHGQHTLFGTELDPQWEADAQQYARKQLETKKRREQEAEEKDETEKASAVQNDNNNNRQDDKDQGKDAASPKKSNEIGVVDLPDFLREANQQLVRCRRVLKYTYVFAYYHFVDPSRTLAKETFEFHQGTLEGLTEGLSKATEKPLAEIHPQDVVNRTRAIGEFIKNVLAHVDDGMDDEEQYQ